jgi:hypothetical protein
MPNTALPALFLISISPGTTLSIRDFAFELSHAPFELFNRIIKLLDRPVDVVAENF